MEENEKKNLEDGEEKKIKSFLKYSISFLNQTVLGLKTSLTLNPLQCLMMRLLKLKVISIKKLLVKFEINKYWRKQPYHLMKRMMKLYSLQEFSVREVKSLRKILDSHKSKKIQISSILKNYPGKTPKSLKMMIAKFSKDKNVEH